MSVETPVSPFFASLNQGESAHAAGIHEEAARQLEWLLKSPLDAPGRGILLRAPRAGYGKTHLLSRALYRLSGTHEWLPLQLPGDSRVEARVVLDGVLRRLSRPLPASGGLSALDLHTRKILAVALQPLVASGEVPSQDREAALAALRQRPVETFDFHQPHAVTAHWTKENFEVLGPRLSLELATRCGASLAETSFWLAGLFRYAVAAPEHPGRTGMLLQHASQETGVERLAGLLALLSLTCRVALVSDEVEGLHGAPEAALRLASFLVAIRHHAPRVDVVLSVNDDVWASSFAPSLSGGLLDRLAEEEIRLEGLNPEQMETLLKLRFSGELPGDIGELREEERYPRRILKWGSQKHQQRLAEQEAQRAESSPFELAEIERSQVMPVAAEESGETRVEEIDESVAAEPVEVAMPEEEVVEEKAVESSEWEPVAEVSRSEFSGSAAPPPLPQHQDQDEERRIHELLKQFRENYGKE